MKQIRKYPFAFGHFSLMLSDDVDLLCVKDQRDTAMLYVSETPEAKLTERRFEAFHTGNMVPDRRRYVGTVMLSGGSYVLHLYEVIQ